jgi:hypothetical protein
MDALQRVLASRTGDLARVLEHQVGIQEAVAQRFVQAAGAELLESFRWQRAWLDVDHLSDAKNARDLLSAVGAGRIAADVGIPRTEVWKGLRAFVPSVLELAEGQRCAPAPRRVSATRKDRRRSRRGPVVALGFLHPIE